VSANVLAGSSERKTVGAVVSTLWIEAGVATGVTATATVSGIALAAGAGGVAYAS
jgi:hypothetical protein